MFGICVFNVVLFQALYLPSVFSQEECLSGGCFPATGDLLVGREDKITATSTCGLNGPSKYCILSFLDKVDKCFYCDSRPEVDLHNNNQNSHLPKYMVTRKPAERLQNWWQSVNGQQNVTIQVNLEAEFVFTHLIMTFKTFRPKAMYIERSWDYGRNWGVYRYFAYNCAQSFPGVSRGPQRRIDDVICEERFSKVEPSTEGEVVMKVLDPIIQQREDPYSFKVQSLLKLTNLRVHFTELHTFGDDVLGDSPKVNQKYYYSLYEMVVRGSCSCYGHAEQCIPAEGTSANVNMVYGQCNCTHNTKGRNCEMCKDGYNDEPWRPAYKDRLNVCRKCNCNGHTEKCHFDPAVYKQTGNRSGGVCDDCQHNTAGRQCEQCKPLYYRDPFKNIFDPDVCKPCDCDPSGSFGGGECETLTGTNGNLGTVAGRCICKDNVEGRRCDTCKDGFWNLLESNPNGCTSCNCNPRGTVENGKCDQQTGVCRCKRYVQGLTCSKCLEGFWQLGSVEEGCQNCNCDVGGSLSNTCDEITGSCQCKPNLMGRKCDKVRPGHYFGNLDQVVSEGENAIPGVIGTPFKVVRKITPESGEKPFTGEGYIEVKEGSIVDFPRIKVPNTGKHEIVIRYDKQTPGPWTDVRVKVTREDGGPLGGEGCDDNRREAYFYPILTADKKSISIGDTICFVKDASYKIQISFQRDSSDGDGTTLVDSVVLLPDIDGLNMFKGREGNQKKQLWNSYNCKQYYLEPNSADDAPEICKKLQFSISAEINKGGLPCNCDAVGTNSTGSSDIITCKDAGGQCPCKPGVIGRRCDQCAPGYYGFGNEGCKSCSCDETGSTSLYCHDQTGQCTCKRRIKGRACNSCPPNHFGFPNCRACQCNEHSSTCDAVTGECTNCKDNTAGPSCNLCAEGYYGDATSGTEKDCQRCQCPGGSSGNQFSNSCYETANEKVICNNCTVGYTGDQCERCDDGYYGNPLVVGGRCVKCNCNGNIDAFSDGKCDTATGKCLKCTNNAAGDQCEVCKKGYFGDATKQNCTACVCHKLGTSKEFTNDCNKGTGQCKCLDNVIGLQCDKCKPGFYDLVSGEGCKGCFCDPVGSLEKNCNQLDGQCKCRDGFGGRTCDQCKDFSWGDPKAATCQDCKCNFAGSTSLQCDRSTGKCNCKPNIIGDKCDMCAVGTSGVMPQCDMCHVCNDQWEDIVNEIEKNVKNLSKLAGNYTFDASEIAEYTRQISELLNRLNDIKKSLNDRSLYPEEINNLRENVTKFREQLMKVDMKASDLSDVVKDTSTRNANATSVLEDLEKRFNNLEKNLKNLRDNITKIIESDIGGALNSTRDSLRRSREAQAIADNGVETIKESKKLRKKIKKEIIRGDPLFEELDEENNELLENISSRFDELKAKVNELNKMLCGNDCDGCNSTSCDQCGMSSNCTGARQLAKKALELAEQAKNAVMKKRDEAQDMLDSVKMAEADITMAVDAAMNAMNVSEEAKKKGEEILKDITQLIKDIRDFLITDFNRPNVSKDLAMKTLSLNISLTPDQVKELANQIRDVVNNLTGVDKILNETEKDLQTAIDLKNEALAAKRKAIAVMNRTMFIVDLLNKTMEMQEETLKDINIAREDIQSTQEKIDEINKKADEAKRHLEMAANDTTFLENGTEDLKKKFEKNQEDLDKNQVDVDRAENLADRVKTGKQNVERRHYNATVKLNRTKEQVDDVRERVKKLSNGAIDLFQTILNKLTIIEDLKKEYLLNEERALDLYDEIRRLEIKAKYINERLVATGTCHGSCNPLTPDDFCTIRYGEIDTDEKREDNQLDNDIRKRQNMNVIS